MLVLCGRYTLTVPTRLAAAFPEYRFPELAPRYNIAPTQAVLGVRNGATVAEAFVWGLRANINARAESVADKPTFRDALRERRAILFADGYYEWQVRGDGKQPYYVHRPDGAPFTFAALWELEASPHGTVTTCAIVTTEATPALRSIHHRMPVILSDCDRAAWLTPGSVSAEAALDVLARGDYRVEAYPVSLAVNRVSNDDPSLTREVRPPQQGDLFG